MTIENLFKHRLQLSRRKSELETTTANLKAELYEAAESQTNFLQDWVDHAKEQSDLSLRLKIYERYMLELRQIKSALFRIENGTFGDCKECGDAIVAKRLLAQPSATLCVECQCKKEVHARAAMAPVHRLNLSGLLPFFYNISEVA
jgi:DnaK suppressor protein